MLALSSVIVAYFLAGIILAETKKPWAIKNRKDYLITVIVEPITFTFATVLGIAYLIFIEICRIYKKTKVVKF